MKKKKVAVLHAQVPFSRGGAELLVEVLIKELKIRGFDSELITMPYKWYPENSLYDSMFMWKMADLSEANGEKIDMIIPTKFPTYMAEHENKVPWIIHQFRQVYDLYEKEVGYKSVPNGLRIKENIIAADKKVFSEMENIYTISKNVSERLKKYNSISSSVLYHPPKLVGNYFKDEFDNFIFSVGRLDKLKRNDLLIEALFYCDKSIKAIIAGKGAEMDALKRLADKKGVSDRVKFLGFVEDREMLELYSKAFAVFFAPVDEDYGYITLEAFLSHKPVITCNDSGGVLEFVKDGENGFVCNANPEEMGGKIQELFDNKNKCAEFGENGYNVVKDISWDNVIDRLTESLR